MASNNIFFVNKYSQGGKHQDYAFFSALPKLCHNPTGTPIYSNVFHSTTLSKDETWSIGLTSSYYAWCGTADRKLSTMAKVLVDMGKLITIGTSSAPGSTVAMSTKGGRASLRCKASLTANTESFAIETGLDALPENCVIGLGAIDDEGQLKPLATMSAASNATINITPVNRFYIASHSSSVGSVVDATDLADHAAVIDFTKNTGSYGVVVTHEADGTFSVKYVTRGAFNKAVEQASIRAQAPAPAAETKPAATSTADPRDAELTKLRQQLKEMEVLLEEARSSTNSTPNVRSPTLAPATIATPVAQIPAIAPITYPVQDPYPGKPQSTWYKAVIPFRSAPGQSRRKDIRDRVIHHMQSNGYVYEGGSMDTTLVTMFSHHAGTYGNWHSVIRATKDWWDALESLPRHLRGFTAQTDECVVQRVQEAKGLWRARGETESRVEHTTVTPVSTRSERTPAPKSTPSKPLTNGVSSSTPAKPVTNGAGATNGVRHGSVTFAGAKSATNGAVTNGVKSANGAVTNGATTNGVKPVKYDYPRVQETAIEAAKRRARAVLEAEGLAEYANGWKVSAR